MAYTPTRALERRNIVLALIAVALGAVLVFRSAPTRGVAMDDLPRLLPDLDTSAVREIEIVREDPTDAAKSERLRIVRQNVTSWVLPDRFDHPALPNTAERLLDALASARDRGTITERQDTFERYRPTVGWKTVRVKDAAGKVLAELAMGRAERSDLIVRVGPGAGSKIVRVARLRPSIAPTTAASWIETQLWPGNLRSASMVRLDLDRRANGGPLLTLVKRGATGEGLGIAAPALDADAPDNLWWLAEPAPGGDADTLEVEDRGRSFTGLVAEDVVAGTTAGSAPDASMGFAKPEVVATFYAQEGSKVTSHTLTVGGRHPEKDAWYVQVAGRPFIYLVGSGHALTSLRAEIADVAPELDAADDLTEDVTDEEPAPPR